MRLGGAPTKASVPRVHGGSDKLTGCASVAGATQVYAGRNITGEAAQNEKSYASEELTPAPRKCNRKCNRYVVTVSHSVHLDATTKKGYSSLLSRLSSLLPEV